MPRTPQATRDLVAESPGRGVGDDVVRSVRLPLSDRVDVPKHVLVRFLDNESVFLNLETEHYYGLDEIGTRMWQTVTAAPYIEAAYEQLLSQFDVEAQQLRQNFSELLERLVNDGLLRVHCANAGMDPAI